jgi:thiol:disulfide interchange protein DsbC
MLCCSLALVAAASPTRAAAPTELELAKADIAAAVTAGGSPESRIRAAFAKSFPTVRITSVGATPWQGVYEAVTPEGIIYADASGQFAMSGKMVDVPTQVNLTDARMTDLHRIDFSTLPFSRAIKSVKGNGRRKLAVFADPDCPYCKRLESELKDLDDVTVYTFLFPIDELHPGATQHAKRIWCSKDPAASWTAWLVDKVEPPEANCAGDPVAELSTLADKLEITGTPTLFLADGRRIPGLIPLDDLVREMGKATAN